MSKSLNSPTSRLLQSSRLFSLPRPLPQPSIENATSGGIYRASDSATLPYPTHQAIATPPSSHSRGDWGLKRPLPAKATRNTSTPYIRVQQQDNASHITDFGSAADYTLTLAKWQQMGVPLNVPSDKTKFTERAAPRSVYDREIDNTDRDFEHRWKYKGPWLPGLPEGEFELWIMSAIAKRKDEFRDFLEDRILKRRVREEQQAMRDRGEGGSISELRRVQLRKEVKDNFELEEKRLRDDHVTQHLASELTAAICDFLDLPGVRGSSSDSDTFSNMAQSTSLQASLASITETGPRGPPTTHPAAGLSHIRSNAILENHPIWGPQAHRSPVLARVVRPRNSAQGQTHNAKLGVGGVVADDPVALGFKQTRNTPIDLENIREAWRDTDRMVDSIEPDLPGGNKAWVHPDGASIDEQGRIKLRISRGNREAIAVAENETEAIQQSKTGYMHQQSAALSGAATEARYGTQLPDMRRASSSQPRSFTRGFDDQLKGQAGKNENETLAQIQRLANQYREPAR